MSELFFILKVNMLDNDAMYATCKDHIEVYRFINIKAQ